MTKAIEENELTVRIKKILWEFNLCWKFMCIDKNSDKNKKDLHPTPFHSSYSFLTAEKLLRLRALFINCFVKN